MADLRETLPENQLTRIPQTSNLRRPSDMIPVEGEVQVLNGRGTGALIKEDGEMDTLQLPKSAVERRGSREMIAGSRPVSVISAQSSDNSDEDVSRLSLRSRRESQDPVINIHGQLPANSGTVNGSQSGGVSFNGDGSSSDSDSDSDSGAPGLQANYHGSFRLSTVERQAQGGMYPRARTPDSQHTIEGYLEDQLPVNKTIRQRSKKAVETGIELLNSDKSSSLSDRCDIGRCCPCLKQLEKPPSLQFAQHAGFKMMPGFFFPAIPKVLQDLWIGLELFVTLFDFLFSFGTFESSALSIFVLVLLTIGLVLALIDGYLYFVEGGSCVACFRFCRKKLMSENSSESNTEESEGGKNYCQFFPSKWKKRLETWFELVRTLITELLLYPLIVSDITGLIIERPFDEFQDPENRVTFALFNIGTFYLVLSVYFMRSFMAISSLLNLRRISKNTKNDYVTLVTKFCIHLVGQLLVNAVILIMIATKIRNEKCQVDTMIPNCLNRTSNLNITCDAEENVTMVSLIPSSFLWYDIVAGYVLPFFGVILFFVVNYPSLKEFSMSFYVDMMSSIVSEGFADLVFQGEGVKQAKEKAKAVQEKANLAQVKTDFEEYRKEFSLRTKVAYRLTHPTVVISSLVYVCLMAAFIICFILGRQDPCDPSSTIEVQLFKGDPGIDSMFFIGTFIIIIANYQAVIIVAGWFAIIGTIIVIVAVIPVLAVIFTPVLFISAAVYLIIQDKKRTTDTNNDE